jgi:HSP20 family protein
MSEHSDDPLERVQREVERLFHSLVYYRHPSCHFAETGWAPPTDLVVSEESARVIVELAGVPRENVRVQLQGNLLEISGRRTPPREPSSAHYHLAEISFGDFHRAIELPWIADESKVDARYRDGMLEIHLQRSAAAAHLPITIQHERAD